MPIPGLFSAFYWPGDGSINTPPVTPVNQYTHPWRHDGFMVGCGLVPPFEVVLPRSWQKKLIRFQTWATRHLPPRLVAASFLFRALFSKRFGDALRAVNDVAQDPSTRHIETWGEIGRQCVSNPAQGENVFRSFAARVKMGSTDPETALLLELAWLTKKAQH